jgi:hypothetical protein
MYPLFNSKTTILMKRIALCLFLLTSLSGVSQKTKNIDPIAISLIDKMGSVIGGMEACSFKFLSVEDSQNPDGLWERNFDTHSVFFRGPDRMAIHSQGNKGNAGYWYNGEFITWYSFDQNNYVTVPAPETIIKTIDSLNNVFGMRFPGADLFYPSFGDDLIEEFDTIVYTGIKSVEGEDCYHIIAENDAMNFQLWIEQGAFYLPKKFLVFNKGNEHFLTEGTFENWDTNPSLPDEIFEFTPPENSALISIMPKNKR